MQIYSSMLIFFAGVQDSEERRQCLDWAQECGLDLQSITKLVVENIRNRDCMDFQTDSEMPLDSGITEVCVEQYY